jgi:hypothetical protein
VSAPRVQHHTHTLTSRRPRPSSRSVLRLTFSCSCTSRLTRKLSTASAALLMARLVRDSCGCGAVPWQTEARVAVSVLRSCVRWLSQLSQTQTDSCTHLELWRVRPSLEAECEAAQNHNQAERSPDCKAAQDGDARKAERRLRGVGQGSNKQGEELA